MNLEDAREIMKTTRETEKVRECMKQKIDLFLESTSRINSICEDVLVQYVTEDTIEYVSQVETMEIPEGANCENMCMKLDSYAQHHLANLGLNHYSTFNEIKVNKSDVDKREILSMKIVVKFNKM